jgi:hypothetical protein
MLMNLFLQVLSCTRLAIFGSTKAAQDVQVNLWRATLVLLQVNLWRATLVLVHSKTYLLPGISLSLIAMNSSIEIDWHRM